jgi:hypothetical protein
MACLGVKSSKQDLKVWWLFMLVVLVWQLGSAVSIKIIGTATAQHITKKRDSLFFGKLNHAPHPLICRHTYVSHQPRECNFDNDAKNAFFHLFEP